MTSFVITLLLAFAVVAAALVLMGISWWLTGSLRIRGGTCGRDPTKPRDKNSCGNDITCGLCGKQDDTKSK